MKVDLGVSSRLLRLRPETDPGDLYSRQFAAMTNRAVITFAPAIFESDDLFSLALFNHFAGDLCARDRRVPVSKFLAFSVHQDIVESELFTCFPLEQIDVDRIAFGNPILSAPGSDDCVCHGLWEKSGKYPRRGAFDK